MKEQLVSFETAELANKKGFDWIISDDKFYDYSGQLDFTFQGYSEGVTENGRTPAPTQSLLQKWLREEHEIHININTFYFEDLGKYGYEVEDIIHKDGWMVLSNTAGTYEEALEKGLQEALKLIKL